MNTFFDLSYEAFIFSVPVYFMIIGCIYKSELVVFLGAIFSIILVSFRKISYDSLAYAQLYLEINDDYEFLFTYLIKILNYLKFNESDFLVIVPLLQILLIFVLSYQNFGKKIERLAFITVWVSSVWYISYSTNALRQGLASLIFWIGFFQLSNNKYLFVIPLFFFALGFHWSVFWFIFLVILIYILSLRLTIVNPILIIISALLFSFTYPFSFLTVISPHLTGELMEDRILPIYRFLSIFTLYLFYYINIKIFNDYVLKIFKFYSLYILVMSTFLNYPEAFSRLHAYIWPVDTFLITIIFMNFYFRIKDIHKNLIKLLISIPIFLFVFFAGYSNIVSLKLLGIL